MKEEKWLELLEEIEDIYKDSVFAEEVDNHFNEGLKKLKKFYVIVLGPKNGPLERHQFEIVQEAMPQILEWVYGIDYYKKNKKRIKKLCNFSHLLSCLLVVIKRQHGKTEILVRKAVASLLCFPNENATSKDGKRIQTFSIKSRSGDHAKEILQRCFEYMEEWDEFRSDFVTNGRKIKTHRDIVLRNRFDSNDIRVLRIVLNTTGLAGQSFFGDEFFKWSSDASQTQMMPQLQVYGTSGFFYTTMEKMGHWCMDYLSNKQSLLKRMCFREICDICLKLPHEQAIKCNHCRRLQAHWIDPEKRKKAMSVMPISEILKEMYNVVPLSTGQLWEEETLREDLIGVSQTEEYFEDYFMFVDPSMTSQDGSWSGTTIIGEDSRGNTIICYLNTDKTDATSRIVNYIVSDLKYFVKNFVQKNNKRRRWFITLFVEHNTINHGLEIFNSIQRDYLLCEKVIFVKGINYKKEQPESGRFGVTKKKGDEERFASLLNRKILKHEIFTHPKCCTRNVMGIEEMKNVLIRQCSHVKGIPYGTGRLVKIVSDKDFNDKKTKNDLYMSLASALYNTQNTKDSENTNLYSQFTNRVTISKRGYFS